MAVKGDAMKNRSGKYFIRLLLFCLLIGSIPVIVVGIASYYMSSSIVQDKVNERSMDALQQTQLRVEQILKTIDHSVTQYISSPLVVNAMSLPYAAEHYQIYNEMYQSMVRSQTFELTISNMTIVNLNGQWGIDNNNIFTFDDLKNLDQLLRYEQLPSFSAWVTNKDDRSPSISLVKKIPLNSLKANGLAIVTIAESELSRLLKEGNQSGTVLVLDNGYELLSEGGAARGQLSLDPLIPELKRNKESTTQFDVSLDGDETSIIARQSSYNRWTYVSAISIKDMTKDSRSIGWVTLAACLLMLLSTCGLALFGSRSFYQPIRQLVSAIAAKPDDPQTVETKDEFALIGARLQSMLQKEDKLSAQVAGKIREMRPFFVLKLIRGEEKNSQLPAKLKEYGYPDDWQWHAVLAIQIDSLDHSNYREEDRDLLLFAIANIAAELIPAHERLDPVFTEQSLITLVGGSEKREETEYKSWLFDRVELVQKAVGQYLSLPISIGISRPRHRLIDAPASCEEALEALRYRIRSGPGSILFIDDVRPGDSIAGVFPHRVAKELCDAVKLADWTRSKELLDQCMALIFGEQADWRQYQMSLIRLYTMLMELMQSNSMLHESPDGSVFSSDQGLFHQILELQSQETIRTWFYDTVIVPLMNKIEQQRKSHAKQISDQVLQMIDQGFETELTLEACAAKLNYHPNHLGPLFSRETGISFSECLQQYRLQMAKKWLIETDMKIGDIAERLTYTNPQNFIRFFRKMENMTPGQYRQQHVGQ
ncbi:hypothetical protein B1748_19320 [Paenibacillus sp. MY03]|nr:hypothetical protein B1748_19320 [Paenibacillus sp. MY03]